MSVLVQIEKAKEEKKPLLALLLDHEKGISEQLFSESSLWPDMIFVGGSTGGDTTGFIRSIRTKLREAGSQIPILLFPGNKEQFSTSVDAILYHSLLSGRNPELLIGQQITVAPLIHESGIEAIPMGYILIDGGVETSVMRVSQTRPMNPNNVDEIVSTTIAAELMGKKLIYLEAGSGAKVPVSSEIIRAVRESVNIPVIVGGGIRTPQEMQEAYSSGADIVVIGNHFEKHPEELAAFVHHKEKCARPVAPSLNGSNPLQEQAYKTDDATETDEKYMRLALIEAEKALRKDEVPIGCIIVLNNQIIGRGYNLTETLADVTAHAEMQALTAAMQTLGAKYLQDATLYVTVEPCAMCASAIGWAQIHRVVYGTSDDKRGFRLYAPKVLHPKAHITSGVLETECRELMQRFFQSKR